MNHTKTAAFGAALALVLPASATITTTAAFAQPTQVQRTDPYGKGDPAQHTTRTQLQHKRVHPKVRALITRSSWG